MSGLRAALGAYSHASSAEEAQTAADQLAAAVEEFLAKQDGPLAGPGKTYTHDPVPDDLPEPGNRCRECGEDITWMGPSQYDWMHVDDERNS